MAPYVLDATRCISYLTIEVKAAVAEDRREDLSGTSSAATSARTSAPGTGSGPPERAPLRAERGRSPPTSGRSPVSTTRPSRAVPGKPVKRASGEGSSGAWRWPSAARATPRSARSSNGWPGTRARRARARRMGAAAARRPRLSSAEALPQLDLEREPASSSTSTPRVASAAAPPAAPPMRPPFSARLPPPAIAPITAAAAPRRPRSCVLALARPGGDVEARRVDAQRPPVGRRGLPDGRRRCGCRWRSRVRPSRSRSSSSTRAPARHAGCSTTEAKSRSSDSRDRRAHGSCRVLGARRPSRAVLSRGPPIRRSSSTSSRRTATSSCSWVDGDCLSDLRGRGPEQAPWPDRAARPQGPGPRGRLRPRGHRPRRRARRARHLRRVGRPRPRRRDGATSPSQVERRSALTNGVPLGPLGRVRGAAVRLAAPLLDRGARGAAAGSRATPGATTITT